MGDTLSRLLRQGAARLYALVDLAYRRWHRLDQVGGILYVGRATWRGQRRRLEDGTEVMPGSPILRLHLNSQLAADVSAGAPSAPGSGLRFARRFLPACRALARRVREDPAWSDAVAVYAVGWISPYVGEPWGFEFERLPAGLRTRLIRWHIGHLLAAAAPAGRPAPAPWPMAIWLSRRRLLERFLDGALTR
jgi:hypothetical protein